MGRADERPFWTMEEFQEYLDAIMDKQDLWVVFRILFWAGMSLGELLALQVKDINFENGTITVDEFLARIGYCIMIRILCIFTLRYAC